MKFNFTRDFVDGLAVGGFFVNRELVPITDERIVGLWIDELQDAFDVNIGDTIEDSDKMQKQFETALEQAIEALERQHAIEDQRG